MARRPYENVFLQWVLEGGHGTDAPDEIVLYRDRTGAVAGAVYFGTQLVIAAEDNAGVDAFAVEARRHPGMRSFVGPKDNVDRLWDVVRSWHRPPVFIRAEQPLYAVQSNALVGRTSTDVRRAILEDAEQVIENSAEMILGELGYDPRRNGTTAFAAGVRRAIALGLWWVWIVDGELRFQLNVGARTNQTAQIQGVWTPPSVRKRGYGALGLAAISHRLLALNATLSLYVNDFNRDAISLYERIGYMRVGTMSTLLF